MLAALVVRPLEAPDITAWAALAREVFSATYAAAFPPETLTRYLARAFDPQSLAATLADPVAQVLGAWQADTLVGFSQVSATAIPSVVTIQPAQELTRLYVSVAQQGTGVAGRLMVATLAATPPPLWLYVWEQNARAIAFYGKWGFVRVGEADLDFEGVQFHDLILQRVGENL